MTNYGFVFNPKKLGYCDRCGDATRMTTMSWFNTEHICPICEKKELKHPDLKRAKEVEFKEVQSGNMNYPGIGKPDDL